MDGKYTCVTCNEKVHQVIKPKNSTKWLCEDCLEDYEEDTI